MRVLAAFVALLIAVVACSSEQGPFDTPTLGLELATLPLPQGLTGIPTDGSPTTQVAPVTPQGSVPIGLAQNYQLGHCGLSSPIDFDGSLWDPEAGDNGAGGPLTQEQLGELINGTSVVLVLVDPTRAQLVTPLGARVVLVRHVGPRPYYLCD